MSFVLFFTKWFPDEFSPSSGIFVRKHAEALAAFTNTAVLFVQANPDPTDDKKWIFSQISEENGLRTARVYYKKRITGINPIDKLIKLFLYVLAAFIGFKKLQKAWGKPTVIVANVLLRPALVSLFFKLRYKIPYIVYEHWAGYLPYSGMFKKTFLKHNLTKLAVRNAAAVGVPSDDLGKVMYDLGYKNKYVTIKNVVDTEIFKPLENKTSESRKYTLLTVANLYDFQKNISGMLRVAKSLQDEGFDFVWNFVGRGEDENSLKLLSQNHETFDKTVFFLGEKNVKEVAACMQQADVLVLFSRLENSPCVIGEANCAGICVIATPVGGVPELIKHGENGWLTPDGDETALKNLIISILSHKNELSEKQVFQKAHGIYAKKIIGEQFFTLCETKTSPLF